jgi:hypothetical protein
MREGGFENNGVSDPDAEEEEDVNTYDGLTGYGIYLAVYLSPVGPLAVYEDPEGEGIRYIEPDKGHPIWQEWRTLRERRLGSVVLQHVNSGSNK